MKLKNNLLLAFLFLLATSSLYSQAFKTVATIFSSEQVSYSEFGDYDNDGDLDVLIKSNAIKVFTNNNGVYVNSGISIPSTGVSSLKWGDLDRDGDLDLAVVGYSISIYKNVNNTYSQYYSFGSSFYFFSSYTSWGDADNDGDLDLMVTGANTSTTKNWLLINSGTSFNVTATAFDAINFLSVVWGDYDNDGDQDLLFTTSSKPVIYINNSLTFTLSSYVFPSVPIILYNTIYLNASIWADYDLDGDLDVVTMGREQNTPYNQYSAIYENQNGSYVVSPVVFAYNMQGQMMKVADMENDGDLDFVSLSASYPWMETNNNNTYSIQYFSRDGYSFEGLNIGSSSLADYDNDGYLDLLHTGSTILNNTLVAYLLSGHGGATTYNSNTAPTFPTNLVTSVVGNDVNFSWNKSTDAQTPQPALTYNLRIGKTPGGSEVLSAMAAANGKLSIPQIGNCNLLRNKTIKGMQAGTYYWSVQAVDNGLLGSAFSPEQTFTIARVLDPPTLISPLNNALNQNHNLNFKWHKPVGAQSYQFQLAYDMNFLSLVVDKSLIDTTLIVDSMRLETNFYWRVRAFEDTIISSWSEIRTFKTSNYFTNIGAPLYAYSTGLSADWGDYDNDGDLDLVTTGYLSYPDFRTKIYRNDNGIFTDINFVCDSFGYSIAKWVDIDNDNNLDIFFNGVGAGQQASRIYKNNNGVFQKSPMVIPANAFKDIDFIDCDNDGDLDILASSAESGVTYDDASYLLINKNDTAFSSTNNGMGQGGAVSWIDYDNDGDFDFFANGIDHSYNSMHTYLLNKVDTTYTIVGNNVVKAYQGELTPFDYDSDGDLDLLMSGMIDDYSMQLVTRVYKNTNGNFSDINAGMIGTKKSSLLWGDYDNDGDADIFAGGTATIYRNDNTVFNQSGISFTGGSDNTAIGDYDHDGDLDIVAVGTNSVSSKIFKNNSFIINTVPVPSQSKVVSADSGAVSLSWDAFTDIETPSAGLSYNIYVKSLFDGSFVMAPSADLTSGYRKIAAIGNVQNHTSYSLKNVNPGLYLWSVQAIDNTFSGSQFATPDTLVVLKAPVLNYPLNNSININPEVPFTWHKSTYATTYQIQVSTNQSFSALIIDSLVTDTAFAARLNIGTTYFWRVCSKRSTSISAWSQIWKFNTVPMQTNYLSNLIICKGATVDLVLNSSSTLLDSLYNIGTKYVVEFINHNPTYSTTIDTVLIAGMDTITVSLPDTISLSNNYRFRIRCLNSSFGSVENNEDISVINYVYFHIMQDSVINNCWNTPLTLNLTEAPLVPFNWYVNGIKSTIPTDSLLLVTQSGQYTLSADSLICRSFSDTVNVTMHKPTIIISPMSQLQMCQGDSISFGVNANPNYTYAWSTSDTISSITVSNFGTFYVVVKDSFQCENTDSVTVVMNPACNVWPGDTDNDFTVSNMDLLPIGLYYSQTGAPRSSVSNSWQSYPASNWGINQTNGSDIKHSDSNGDGIVNNDDTLAIHLNFSSIHNKIIATNNDHNRLTTPDIYLVTSSNSYNQGDWVDAEVWIGNSTTSVSNLYGISFNISYDATLVQPGTEILTYPNSWLAAIGTNAIKFEKTDAGASIVYGGVTRIDHNNVNGFGKIANFRFQVKSSITSTSLLYFSISNYKANDASGALQVFNTPNNSIIVNPLSTGVKEIDAVSEITIWPNPFTNQTSIAFNSEQKNTTIKVKDILGKEIKTIIFSGKQVIFERNEMPAGIYFLQIIDEKNNSVIKRIIIQ